MNLTYLVPVLSLLTLPPSPEALWREHGHAEQQVETRSTALATGDFDAFKGERENATNRWPVTVLSIGHTMVSYQRYGGLSEAYFHHGLDIRADAGTPVYASRGGKVVNIENYVLGSPQYWEVAILDADGFLWQYHHVEKSTIPEEVWNAFNQKKEIADGAKIGTVVYWPIVSFGERYHHIHLNILGKNKEYLNPFNFLDPLNDNIPPEIASIGILKNDQEVDGNRVSGPYTLYAHVKDLILSKVFTVPPETFEIQIDNQLPQVIWHFDRLPGGASNEQYSNDFFVPSMVCGNYECRKPVVNLGFKKSPTQIFPMTPGEHSIELRVKDHAGLQATKNFTWIVE